MAALNGYGVAAVSVGGGLAAGGLIGWLLWSIDKARS